MLAYMRLFKRDMERRRCIGDLEGAVSIRLGERLNSESERSDLMNASCLCIQFLGVVLFTEIRGSERQGMVMKVMHSSME